MIENLLRFGLVFIPFYELVTTLLLPAQSVAFFDTRFPKECAAFLIAILMIMVAVYQGSFKRFRNVWILLFMGFLIVSINKAPVTAIALGSFDISGFWVWKPFLQLFVYFLLLLVVSSMEWNARTCKAYFMVMAWCGFIMAGYVVLQKFGFDQFFYQKPESVVLLTSNPTLIGTMGQPTLVAPFLAMCIIPAIYLKNWIFSIVMLAALFMINSEVASFAVVVAILTFVTAKNPIAFGTVLAICVLIAVLMLSFLRQDDHRKHFNDNGRLSVWSTIVNDLKEPFSAQDPRRFSLTGFGIGSFEYLFHAKHHSEWRQAHNEYLELLYCVGFIGLSLFMMGLVHIFKTVYRMISVSREAICLLAMTVAACLCAAGTFIWHLAVYQFYGVVIVGLIYSLNRHLNRDGEVLA